MWSERVALHFDPDAARPPSATEPNDGTRPNEEARLQAAIAMTQLSSTPPLGPDQVHWCHLALGGTEQRAEEEEERAEDSGPTVETNRLQGVIVVVGTGEAFSSDPETGEVQSATDVGDSSSARPAEGQEVAGESSALREMDAQSGRSLLKSCVHEGKTPKMGNKSEFCKKPERIRVKANRGVWTTDATGKTSLSEEPGGEGKFVRTAQPSGSGKDLCMDETPEGLTIKVEDTSRVRDVAAPVFSNEDTSDGIRMTLNDTRPSKVPQQRNPQRNPSSRGTRGESRSSNGRHKFTGTGGPSTESEQSLAQGAVRDQSMPRVVFVFNRQTGVLVPLAPLAPVSSMTTDAERRLLAWLPSNVVAVPRGTSLASTTSESPSCTVPRHADPIPRATSTLPSISTAAESSPEDVDRRQSPEPASAAKSSSSRLSSERANHCGLPGGKSEAVRVRTRASGKTFLPVCGFQVEGNRMETENAKLIKVSRAEKSERVVPLTEGSVGDQVIQGFEFENIQGVDLSTRKFRNTIGATSAAETSTESEMFAEPEARWGSCTSPLDLTTRTGFYGSLGTPRNFHTLSGTTAKAEEDDNFANRGNPNDPSRSLILSVGPNEHDAPGMRGLAQAFGHGSVISDIKGISPFGPTSLMIGEQNSPSAEMAVDKHAPTKRPMDSFLRDIVSDVSETEMSFPNPLSRCKQSNSELSGTIRDLSCPKTKDLARATLSPSLKAGHNWKSGALDRTGHSRPESQCSSDLQVDTVRLQGECHLPPKKRKMHVNFDEGVQPHPCDLDRADGQSSLKSSGKEELTWNVNHREQCAPNYDQQNHLPFAIPSQRKEGAGDGGGGDRVQRIKGPCRRDETPTVAKLEIGDGEDKKQLMVDDELHRETATIQQEATVGGACYLSSLSSSSSSPISRTTTNCAFHSAIQPDEDGDLPLHVAVAQGLEPVVDSLVSVMSQLHTHIDTFNRNRQTPLHVAVITNQPEMIRKLLQAGACPNLSDRKGHNSVHLAVNNRCHDCLRILESESKYPVDVNAMNYEGLTPLQLAVQLGDVNSVEALLSFGAQVNGVDGKNGRTALYYAAERSDLASAELLLQAGANPSIASYSGCLPVNAARSNSAMVKLFDRYSAGGDAAFGMDRSAAAAAAASAAAAGGFGVGMATTKTGNKDAKRREIKQGKNPKN